MKPRLVSRLTSLVRLTSLSLAVAALAWSGWAGTLDLAVRGRAPEYAIVRAADASPSVKYAAEELSDFTERLTGVRLPIVEVTAATSAALPPKAVFLNMSRLTSHVSRPLNLGDDGFSLKVVEGDLLVTGGNRGVLYGVYELLERYGGEGSSECLFTVRNASEKAVDAVLSPELPVAALSPVWRGSVAPRKVDGGFELRLDPWQTAVFKAE